MDSKWNFVNPPPAPDLKWGIYVEERIGMSPASYRLFGYDDPAEAWACLLTALERSTRNRIFYIKERGRQQRWTEFRKTVRHLFRYSRRRYYLGYEDFLAYASGKPRPEYTAPPPDEGVPAELLTLPDCAVENVPAADTRSAPAAIKRALSTQSEWSARQKKRRL